jgi:hypothetical protein
VDFSRASTCLCPQRFLQRRLGREDNFCVCWDPPTVAVGCELCWVWVCGKCRKGMEKPFARP